MFDATFARLALATTLTASLAFGAGASRADTIKVLTTGAFKQVVLALVPPFETRTGHHVEVSNDTAGAVVKRVDGGEAFDVLILTPAALKTLATSGMVVPDTVVTLAKVGIGVAVKAGSPPPDISTVDAFKRALVDAKKIAYIDPASGGSSGVYLDGLFARLNLTDIVKPKAVLVNGGLVAETLVKGEADLAVHQVSEILPVAGVALVGELPEAIQNYTRYGAAVSAHTSHGDAARAFVGTLAGDEGRSALKAKGMLPEG